MRDCKKFCRPNLVDNPEFGDILIKLNKKRTGYMKEDEYNKVSRYFKLVGIYGLVSKEDAQIGDIVVEGNLIVKPENYNKQDKQAIGIVYMTTKLTGDGKIRFMSLDYMNPYDPENGAPSTHDDEYGDLRPYFGGYLYDETQAVSEYEGGDWDIDGHGYPNYNTLINNGWKIYEAYPKSTDKIHIHSTDTYVYAPSIDNGTYPGPTEASIFKYKLNSNFVPVPYFNNGELNSEFRANSYTIPGTSTVVEFNNTLSDINGKVNCDIILNFIKNSGHDNTITLIDDESTTSYEFPAIMCCHLYNKGNVEWYLPAMGELAYIYAHYKLLNATREVLGLEDLETNYYWSSTLMGKDSGGVVYVGSMDFYGSYCGQDYFSGDRSYAIASSAF